MCLIVSNFASTSTDGSGSPNSLSETVNDCKNVDEHLWGFLQPSSTALTRIDFWRNRPRYTIGRSYDTNQIILPGPTISNEHCVIAWEGGDSYDGAVLVTDLSKNGTFINGEKIGRNKTRILNEGNEIAFGGPFGGHSSSETDDYRFVYRHVARTSPTDGLHQHYDISSQLGHGGFGTVFKALRRATGEWFAVKTIAAGKTAWTVRHRQRDHKVTFAREISIMKELKHRNVCKLIETYVQDDGDVNLVLELVGGGDLGKYLSKNELGISEPRSKDITYQICDAMAYIHSKGVTHRDLKLENILVTREEPPLIKVADFGLAKVLNDQTFLRTICGTREYIAPEVILGESDGYDNLVDSWAVGVIVFSILTNRTPFRERANAFRSIKAYILKRRVDWSVLQLTTCQVSHTARRFIRRLLQENPKHRLSLTEAIHHQWLRLHVPYHGFSDDSDLENAVTQHGSAEAGRHAEKQSLNEGK